MYHYSILCVLCTKCTFNRNKISWKLVRHWESHHSCTTNWRPHIIPTYDRDYHHLPGTEIVVKSYYEIPNSIHFDRVAKDHTNADLGLECFGWFMLMSSECLGGLVCRRSEDVSRPCIHCKKQSNIPIGVTCGGRQMPFPYVFLIIIIIMFLKG